MKNGIKSYHVPFPALCSRWMGNPLSDIGSLNMHDNIVSASDSWVLKTNKVLTSFRSIRALQGTRTGLGTRLDNIKKYNQSHNCMQIHYVIYFGNLRKMSHTRTISHRQMMVPLYCFPLKNNDIGLLLIFLFKQTHL